MATDAPDPGTLAQYGLPGHLPRCRAVRVARELRILDPSRCDCGAVNPNDHEPVITLPVPRLERIDP